MWYIFLAFGHCSQSTCYNNHAVCNLATATKKICSAVTITMTTSYTKGHLATRKWEQTRSKDSERKWVLFVLCGTRCFIKPVYVRDILLQGPWAAGKHIHKYGDTTWPDNKSYVIMLLLTGSAKKQTQHKEACINVQIQMYTAGRFNKRCPILFPTLCPLRQKGREGPLFGASRPGASHPGGALISTTAGTLHTRDTSLFCGCKVQWQAECGNREDTIGNISSITHQEAAA